VQLRRRLYDAADQSVGLLDAVPGKYQRDVGLRCCSCCYSYCCLCCCSCIFVLLLHVLLMLLLSLLLILPMLLNLGLLQHQVRRLVPLISLQSRLLWPSGAAARAASASAARPAPAAGATRNELLRDYKPAAVL